MEISPSVLHQIRLFCAAMAWGAAVVVAYDCLRIFRRLISQPVWLCSVQDAIFWIAEAFFIYRLMFRYDSGAIRSYTMLGMLAGMGLYLLLLDKIVVRTVTWLLKKLLNIFIKPFKVMMTIFRKIRNFFRRLLKKFLKSLAKMLKKNVKTGRMGITSNQADCK